MAKTVLLLGRTPFALEDVKEALGVQGVTLLAGTSLDQVVRAFDVHEIDLVIMGAGLALDDRLKIVEHAFTVSNSTSVHMKDRASGMQGMLPFVEGILSGLA